MRRLWYLLRSRTAGRRVASARTRFRPLCESMEERILLHGNGLVALNDTVMAVHDHLFLGNVLAIDQPEGVTLAAQLLASPSHSNLTLSAGPMSVNAVTNSHRLFGDGNGDGVVDTEDLDAFGLAYGSEQGMPGYVSWFDYNSDGVIDADDLDAFGASYGSVSSESLPSVALVQVNDGTAQRSMVTGLTVTFSQMVTLSAGVFELRDGTGNLLPATVSWSTQVLGGQTVATLSFSGTGVIGGSLADGVFTLTVLADRVSNSAGSMSVNAETSFYRLFGDGNGDGVVDTKDLDAFVVAYGSGQGMPEYVSWFDYNSDGIIDADDLDAFGACYGSVSSEGLPSVALVQVNDGTAQRSMVTGLTVTFSQMVTLSAGVFELRDGAGNLLPATVSWSTQVLGGQTVATLSFSGTGVIGGSLADGVFTLTVLADRVSNSAGSMSVNAETSFYRLFGDGNGDGVVDTEDLDAFVVAYGSGQGMPEYVSWFDYNSDGIIDADDLDAFGARYGSVSSESLPSVALVQVNDGTAQRSMVTGLTVTFNQVVTLSAEVFELRDGTGNLLPATVSWSTQVLGGQTVATLSFSGTGVIGGSLADGVFTLTVLADRVSNSAGSMSVNAETSFYRLFGDGNGDGVVDTKDLDAFVVAYGSGQGMPEYVSWFDYNSDGIIDADDLDAFGARYGSVSSESLPSVALVQVNDGSGQRSMVTGLTVTFSEVVTLSAGVFELRDGTGTLIPATVSWSTQVLGGQTVATLSFSGTGVIGGSLADGVFTLTVLADRVSNSAGSMSVNAETSFYRLFGDGNGDGVVDTEDLDAFVVAYGSGQGMPEYVSWFDYNSDGIIDADDLDAFGARYGSVSSEGLPSVALVQVNDGTAQRSMVTGLTVTFSQVVTLSAGVFELRDGTGNLLPATVSWSTQVLGGQTVATLSFSGTGVIGGSLADGVFTLTVLADRVSNSAGSMSVNAETSFYRLFGDGNGDGVVDTEDLDAFVVAYGSGQGMPEYVSWFDYNSDGVIDADDLDAFGARYGKRNWGRFA